jgi:tripartite ATP-independent transporter DctM subunit
MIVGVIGIVAVLILVFAGVPIAFSLLTAAFLGFIYLSGWNVTVHSVGTHYFAFTNSYDLGVLLMFFFMGHLGYYSGVMESIFDAARRWLGRVKGGIALSVVAASTAYAACSGSSVASCLIIGKSAIPTMRKAGYSDALATGVVAASGTLASIIPPSALIVVYALLVDQSIGKLLIAAILPGFLTAAVYAITGLSMSRNVQIDPQRFTWKEKIYSIRYLWVIFVCIFAIMGCMYLGICTPTEGGAIGAFVTFVMGLVARKMDWKIFKQSVKSTATSGGTILVILVASVFFSRFLTLSGFSNDISNLLASAHFPALGLFIILSIAWLALGCIVDAVSMLVMTMPIMYPIMMGLGFDPIWFGIIAVKYCEIAVLTPPVAVNLFALKSVAPNIPMSTIIKGVIPFIGSEIVVVAVLYAFPQIATWLPSMMSV